MNPLHYPSLELQIKLKKIGFTNCETVTDTCGNYIRHTPGFDTWEYNPCPNVMEMLDVIPCRIFTGVIERWLSIKKNLDGSYTVSYGMGFSKFGTSPNAIADIILWLVENKHLSFDK